MDIDVSDDRCIRDCEGVQLTGKEFKKKINKKN